MQRRKGGTDPAVQLPNNVVDQRLPVSDQRAQVLGDLAATAEAWPDDMVQTVSRVLVLSGAKVVPKRKALRQTGGYTRG
jgi:hypothetical protein